MNEWHDLFLGEVGASAALAGLLFVAISINLSRIVGYPGLPGRAAEALLLLGAVLVVSSVELVPQPAIALGIEATLPVVAGGTLVALGSGAGQYCVAGGLVVSIVAALGTAWVLLVEII